MPVGDPLPVVLPDQARRVTPPGGTADRPDDGPARGGCAAACAAGRPEQRGDARRGAAARPAQPRRGLHREAPDRQPVTVRGVLRTVTLRPRGGVPALEAELYDGSDVLTLIFLGRRRITGVAPGPVAARVRPHRTPRRDAADVQPALRAVALMTDEQQQRRRAARPADVESVEQLVRGQLAKALGGRRGMIEAAVPTLVFTVLWLRRATCAPPCW